MTNTTHTETETTHPFERMGLGRAPYRWVGLSKQVYQACHGAPVQPGTSCDYCFTGIMVVCHIEDASGRRFKVGSDCIAKIGAIEPTLAYEAKRAMSKHNAELRKANAARKADAARQMIAENADALRSMPHPHKWAADEGRSMLDYAEWMLRNAGDTGKSRLAKELRAALATAR